MGAGRWRPFGLSSCTQSSPFTVRPAGHGDDARREESRRLRALRTWPGVHVGEGGHEACSADGRENGQGARRPTQSPGTAAPQMCQQTHLVFLSATPSHTSEHSLLGQSSGSRTAGVDGTGMKGLACSQRGLERISHPLVST